MTNPYSPPAADVVDAHQKPGSPILAVVLGLLVDIGGSLIAGMVFFFIYAIVLVVQGESPEEVSRTMASFDQKGWLYWFLSAVGGLFSILGGFVCARISRRTDYRLGYVLAGATVLAGTLLGSGGYSIWESTILIAVTVACVFIGLRLGMQKLLAGTS